MAIMNELNPEEQQFMHEVPVMITFLIAGSDNNIDDQEREWALKLVEFRSERNEPELAEFYHEVEKQWEDNFVKYAGKLLDYPDAKMRNNYLAKELEKTGELLAKLAPGIAEKLYDSFRTFARQVAQASGGILGFGAISPEEHTWLALNMIKDPGYRE